MTEPILSPPAFRVRSAAPGDLEPIRAWLPQAFWGSPRPEFFAATAASGALAGAAALRLQPDKSGQLRGYFLLFVEPAQRRRGCGRCLLQVLQSEARRRGVSHLRSDPFLDETD